MQTTKTPQPVALPLYTIPDAAEMLRTSETYLRDRIKAGELSSVDLGTPHKQKLRIPADALQAFLQQRLTTATAAQA